MEWHCCLIVIADLIRNLEGWRADRAVILALRQNPQGGDLLESGLWGFTGLDSRLGGDDGEFRGGDIG